MYKVACWDLLKSTKLINRDKQREREREKEKGEANCKMCLSGDKSRKELERRNEGE